MIGAKPRVFSVSSRSVTWQHKVHAHLPQAHLKLFLKQIGAFARPWLFTLKYDIVSSIP